MMVNYIKLIRFQNLLMMALTQVFMVVFALPNDLDKFSFENFVIPLLSVILVAGGGYVINDFYDQEIDEINKPKQRIIGKKISEQKALYFYFILCGLALGISVLHLKLFILNLIFIGVLWSYARFLKKTPFLGNLVVALCTASAVWIINIPYSEIYPKILFFSVFALFSNLIREIVKDLEDQKGDALNDCRTLPIVLGIKKTKSLIYLLIILFEIVLFLDSMLFSFEKFLIYVIFAELALVWSIYKIHQAQTRSAYHRLSSFYKIFMLSGIFSVILF